MPGDFVPRSSVKSENDAIEDALRGLGYSTPEIRQALQGVTLSDEEPAALRQALSLLRRS